LAQRSSFRFFIGHKTSRICSLNEVVRHDDCTGEVQAATDRTQPMQRKYLHCCLEEVFIHQESIGIELFPHETLDYAGHIHWQGIEDDSKCSQPEVDVGEFRRVEIGLPHSWNRPVEHGEDEESIP